MKKIIALVAGARPNFMKIAPIIRALGRAGDGLQYRLIHTGQHYDREMNGVFFEELGIPAPHVCFESGSGSHAKQTGRIMLAFERYLAGSRADLVLVVGDVNSTLACAIVAKKERIPVAHVEAGLRSGDMAMPEEVNRIVTDSITDLFFATEPAALANLLREGKPRERIFHVGHVMVDNLVYQRDQLARDQAAKFPTAALKAEYPRYGVVTLHRPSNVDDPAALRGIAFALRDISQRLPLVFPVHPRTRVNLQKFGIELGPRVVRTPPLSYMEFLNLWKDAVVVLTDSGGLQEETTALGVPCITLRENTERPVTVTEGTNVLAGTDPVRIAQAAAKVLRGDLKAGRRPALWDGRAAERIVQILQKELVSRPRARIAA
jgi:UDP-N-acetylglucosamine 2-epimerase (non-hydrolysing)